MLKVKLSRVGKKNQPQYRIVVSEAKSKRDGAYTDHIGYYNPLEKPSTFTIDLEKYNDWLEKGAQPTNTIRHLVKKHTLKKEKPATKTTKKPSAKKVKKSTKTTKK